MNEKRTIKKSLVLSKEVIRLNTYESIIQFKSPVRPLISRLTPIPVSFVCLFCGWSLHTNMVAHIFAYGKKMTLSFISPLTQTHKQTDHTTAQSNSVFGPAGISKSPGNISLTFNQWRSFWKNFPQIQKHSQCFSALIHVRQSIYPTLNESSAFFTKRLKNHSMSVEPSPRVVLPTIRSIIYCYSKSRDESGCRNPWLWVTLTFHMLVL